MAYEFFYEGNPTSLDPDYGARPDGNYTGYRMSAGELSFATDPRTANQLQMVSNTLNTGAKTVEVSQAMDARIFEAIPDQHLTEINRLSKLAGAQLSLHLPIAEPSGYSREGWNEAGRLQVENMMLNQIKRGHLLDPKGNIVMTVHSSAQLPEAIEKIKTKEGERAVSALIADSRTGEVKIIKEQERYFPEREERKGFDIKKELERRNEEVWSGTLSNLSFSAYRGNEIVEEAIDPLRRMDDSLVPEEIKQKYKGKEDSMLKAYSYIKDHEEVLEKLPEETREIFDQTAKKLDYASPFLRESYNNLRELYDRVYKETKEGSADRKMLDDFKKEITPIIQGGDKPLEKDPEKLRVFSNMLEKGIKVLNSIEHPNIYIPFNDFLIDKSSDTFANVAYKSYKEFKDSTPILSIENPPAGQALSRAEDLKALVKESREKFKEKVMKDGLSEEKAEQLAKKIIGATWDVGHINMIRKYGYDKADLVKEAETIAPFLKHVHLSDNFGGEHTELPMGMGNVPIKDIFNKFKDAGVLDKVKKVSETGDWFQHFKVHPIDYQLEAFGSPLYRGMASPYWNQVRAAQASYYAGFGTMLPEQHFSMYGSGFSSLPMELGGQVPGAKSRSTGTPTD